jgi:ribosomal protein S18 acetylase RimI-like enzyme
MRVCRSRKPTFPNLTGPFYGKGRIVINASDIDINTISELMVPDVVNLHFEAFSGFMNTRIGRRYVYAFINWFRCREDAIALAALVDGVVVGYTVGAPLGYQQHLNRDLLRVAAQGMITHPGVFFDLRFLRKLGERLQGFLGNKAPAPQLPELPPPTMSLVGIGVATKWRGLRIGEHLVEAFEADARAQRMGSLRLSVKTNNPSARKLYERCGWSPYFCPGKDEMYYFLVCSATSS